MENFYIIDVLRILDTPLEFLHGWLKVYEIDLQTLIRLKKQTETKFRITKPWNLQFDMCQQSWCHNTGENSWMYYESYLTMNFKVQKLNKKIVWTLSFITTCNIFRLKHVDSLYSLSFKICSLNNLHSVITNTVKLIFKACYLIHLHSLITELFITFSNKKCLIISDSVT